MKCATLTTPRRTGLRGTNSIFKMTQNKFSDPKDQKIYNLLYDGETVLRPSYGTIVIKTNKFRIVRPLGNKKYRKEMKLAVSV